MTIFAHMTKPERIILGIDPGTNVLGYGVLRQEGRKVTMEAMGVIDLRKCTDVYLKLGRIYSRVMGIIDAFHPDELAIEAPFFGKNVQSMLKLGRAQGVVIAAAISREIPIHEYAPLKIKQAITGNGQASKEQVAAMMQRLLRIAPESMLPYLMRPMPRQHTVIICKTESLSQRLGLPFLGSFVKQNASRSTLRNEAMAMPNALLSFGKTSSCTKSSACNLLFYIQYGSIMKIGYFFCCFGLVAASMGKRKTSIIWYWKVPHVLSTLLQVATHRPRLHSSNARLWFT